MFKVLLVSSLSLSLLGCSLLNRKATTSAKSAPVRDVPFKARSGHDLSLRKRVLVLPFLDEKVKRSQDVAKVSRNALVRSLSRYGRFVIVRNSDFPQDIAKFVTENKEYDLEKMAPIAAGMGVSAVVEGKIMEVKAKRISDEVGLFRKVKARVSTTVRLRVISAKNGRIILDDVRKGNVEAETTRVAKNSYSDRYLEEDPNLIKRSVNKAFKNTIVNIVKAVEKLSWEGRVALISGERVYINAGRLSGIQVGDILKITEEGEEVYDPDNGGFIGHAPGRMKGTVEVVSYFGQDGAIALVHSGSGFKENDRVELY